MNTQTRDLRILCPQGCGATLTVPIPTPAEVNDRSDDASPTNLDAILGRNVLGAVLVHCLYACTAISAARPMSHVVGSHLSDIDEPYDVGLRRATGTTG
jgi:hypothetical protein